MENIKDLSQTYKPQPLNVDDVILPEELDNIIELLAEQVHETWAVARIKDGWHYGTQRDDNNKTTPCLVPYNQLPESEKNYDRVTAIQTLKFIIKQGFKILKS